MKSLNQHDIQYLITKEVVFLTIDSWFTDIKQVILRTLGFYHPLVTDFVGNRSSFPPDM